MLNRTWITVSGYKHIEYEKAILLPDRPENREHRSTLVMDRSRAREARIMSVGSEYTDYVSLVWNISYHAGTGREAENL